MAFQLLISNFNIATFKPSFLLFHVFITFLLFLSHGSIVEADKVTMHIGKEHKIAMKIALENKRSKFHKLSGGDTTRLAHADSGARSQVPVFSVAAAPLTPALLVSEDQKPMMRNEVVLTDCNAKPMNIVVPGIASMREFLKPEVNSDQKFSGYVVSVYEEVRKILEKRNIHDLPPPKEFHPINASYSDLVKSVGNNTYDAAVGDITILAERWPLVEFTEPFMESGLLMVVPVKDESSKAWLFLKPFTMEMWVATGCIMLYIMFIVWFLEQRSNPAFSGPWKDQLGNTLWFTFSTLFFAHREKIKSNYTRTVVVVWLFVVLILIQSYTASLTSMLTLSRLRPTVTDLEWLKRTDAVVGCDGLAFVRDYLEKVYHFKPKNIKVMSNENEYLPAFKNRSISAAFLEVPYAKVFVNKHCKQFDYGNGSYTSRFGGFGFAFRKGSTLAANVSEAILELSENGTLKELENKLFGASSECTNSQAAEDYNSLSMEGFRGLYIISAATSTICFLLYLVGRWWTNARRITPESTTPTPDDETEMV